VFWTVVFLLLNNVFIRINVYTDNPKIVSYMRGDEGQLAGYASAASVCKYSLQALYFGTRTRMGGAFWFLETLMKVSVSYCIVYYLLRNVLRLNTRKAFAVQWMLSVVFLFSGYGCFLLRFNTAGLDRVLSYYILIHSGYTAKKYSLSTKKRSTAAHILILLSACGILLVGSGRGSVALSANSYRNPFFFLVMSFAGWQFLYELADGICRVPRIRQILLVIGQNTLAVVAFHFLSFKIVSYLWVVLHHQPFYRIAAFPVPHTGGAWWLVYTVIGVGVPVFLNLLWQKAKSHVKNEREMNQWHRQMSIWLCGKESDAR
jgi:fucose 4-O-acetylase-like acetyltransferase